MQAPRLDRLSALLEGLCPRVSISSQAQAFSLHILRAQNPQQLEPEISTVAVDSMRLLVCPAGHTFEDHLAPGEQRWMSFEVVFDGPVGPAFLAEFGEPMAILIKDADPSLAQIAHLIASEMEIHRCGQPLLMNRAGDILLIGLMRHLISRPQKTTGLFTALSDPRIAKSLVALHANTAHPWTLESLAQIAGMSRTSFATHFKEVMQISPGKYLENLRLAIAHQMVASGMGLKQIAQKTGYASPSTLSRAMGRSVA
ncbi:MAG: helix-turn-helix domain-containing protein [Polaromonas sp.]